MTGEKGQNDRVSGQVWHGRYLGGYSGKPEYDREEVPVWKSKKGQNDRVKYAQHDSKNKC